MRVFVFCVLGLVWVAGWLCNLPQAKQVGMMWFISETWRQFYGFSNVSLPLA